MASMWGGEWITCWVTYGEEGFTCDGVQCRVTGAYLTAGDDGVAEVGKSNRANYTYNCDNGCFVSSAYYDCPESGGGGGGVTMGDGGGGGGGSGGGGGGDPISAT